MNLTPVECRNLLRLSGLLLIVPSPSKMTSVGKISADVATIEMGEKGNMNDLLFTDPFSVGAHFGKQPVQGANITVWSGCQEIY